MHYSLAYICAAFSNYCCITVMSVIAAHHTYVAPSWAEICSECIR